MATKMTREEAIKIVQSATVWTDEERDALAMLIPELAESEDEKIRKELVAFFKAMQDSPWHEEYWHDLEIVRILVYLEKQKDEEGYEAIPVESTLEYKLGFKAGKDSEKQKEQKPAEWSEEDSDNLERVDNYLWMLDNYVGDDCATPQGKADKIRGNIQEVLSPWLKSLPERFNLQPKSAECSKVTINGEPIPTENHSVNIPLAE